MCLTKHPFMSGRVLPVFACPASSHTPWNSLDVMVGTPVLPRSLGREAGPPPSAPNPLPAPVLLHCRVEQILTWPSPSEFGTCQRSPKQEAFQ